MKTKYYLNIFISEPQNSLGAERFCRLMWGYNPDKPASPGIERLLAEGRETDAIIAVMHIYVPSLFTAQMKRLPDDDGEIVLEFKTKKARDSIYNFFMKYEAMAMGWQSAKMGKIYATIILNRYEV